jgi:hypothetical protein
MSFARQRRNIIDDVERKAQLTVERNDARGVSESAKNRKGNDELSCELFLGHDAKGNELLEEKCGARAAHGAWCFAACGVMQESVLQL